MRRTLIRSATVTSLVLGATVGIAIPAVAGRPQDASDHDCRVETAGNPGLLTGLGGQLPRPRRRRLTPASLPGSSGRRTHFPVGGEWAA